jgi:PAS domain S-box-containing protein
MTNRDHSTDNQHAAAELQRTVSLLLATQQELIDARHSHDRQKRLLESIVRFSELASNATSSREYWQHVVDSCAAAFEAESAFVLESDGYRVRMLAHLGPSPQEQSDQDSLHRLVELGELGAAVLLTEDELSQIQLQAVSFGALAVASTRVGAGRGSRHVFAGITKAKAAFFPEMTRLVVPALRLFASQAWSVHELLRSRDQISLQLEELDESHRALQESEAKYRHLFEDSADGMALVDPTTGIIIDCNATLAAMAQTTRSALTGSETPWRRDEDADDSADAAESQRAVLPTTGHGKIPVELRSSRMQVDGVDYLLYTLHDLTRRERAEAARKRLIDQLNQSQKMESIGRMAGGIAHDFNNLLTVICGYSDMLQRADNLVGDQRVLLGEILTASRRAQGLTQQLLTFSRKQVIRPIGTDMNQQVATSVNMYQRIIGEDIAMTFTPCAEPTPILADPQQVGQVLGNLLINARDAIHASSGERPRIINVTTRIVRNPVNALSAGDFVQLVVSDTGCGIPESDRPNIFEPFFTTKEVGKGTGLGLATVFGIIKQNNGKISFESKEGRGSSFTIDWPVAHDVRVTKKLTEPELATGPGSGLVLLVEDDNGVREFVMHALRRSGYQVNATPSPEDALAKIDHEGLRPDILVTDVVMPSINGKVLADMVHRRLPQLPILFISGYSDDIVAQHGVLREGMKLLEKPFSIRELVQRIQDMLQSPGNPSGRPHATEPRQS